MGFGHAMTHSEKWHATLVFVSRFEFATMQKKARRDKPPNRRNSFSMTLCCAASGMPCELGCHWKSVTIFHLDRRMRNRSDPSSESWGQNLEIRFDTALYIQNLISLLNRCILPVAGVDHIKA